MGTIILLINLAALLIGGMLSALCFLGWFRMELRKYRKSLKQYEGLISEIRERQHNFADQLDAIYAMFVLYQDYDTLVKRQQIELNHLRQYLQPADLLVLGCPLVIAHLHHKMNEAERRKIPVKTVLNCGIQDLKIPDIFLVEIIGNLWDNAVEETENMQEGGQIILKVRKTGKEIGLSVANRHEFIPYEEYCRFFQKGYSTKGAGRGIGLTYVKKIVKRYHGRIELGNIKENYAPYFQVSVYFSTRK